MKRSNGKLKSSIESGKRNCPPKIRFRFTKPGYMEGSIFASSSTLTKNSSYWYVPNTKISQKMKKKNAVALDLTTTYLRLNREPVNMRVENNSNDGDRYFSTYHGIGAGGWYIMYRDISRYQYLSIQRHLAFITTSCFSFMPYVFSLALSHSGYSLRYKGMRREKIEVVLPTRSAAHSRQSNRVDGGVALSKFTIRLCPSMDNSN